MKLQKIPRDRVEYLIQVTAPRFVAAFCVDGYGYIWDSAPILKFLQGKKVDEALAHCARQGWKTWTSLKLKS